MSYAEFLKEFPVGTGIYRVSISNTRIGPGVPCRYRDIPFWLLLFVKV